MTNAVRLTVVLAVVALIPSTSTAPVDPVTALAPVEVWADGFGDLQGVAIDAEGIVHVVDRQAETVVKIAPDRSRTLVVSGLDRPTGLAFDPSGRLVIAEEGANRVIRVEDDGSHTTLIANVRGPRWLVVRSDGTLDVSARATAVDTDDSEAIWRRSASGEITMLTEGFGDLPGQRAQGFTMDARDTVVATTSERTIVKLRPDGTRTRFAAGLADPHGLAFDADGHLFVADGSAGRVIKLHAPAPPVFGAIPPFTNASSVRVGLIAEPGAAVVVEGASTVTGTANAHGAIELAVPLTPNTATRLVARAIGRGGDGLTSRAVEATIVHDSVAPTIDWPSPVTGTAAGVAVAIRFRAADAGSGVSSIMVTVDGRPLSVTSTPSLPARLVTATAEWDDTHVTDGVHTVTVIASDRAGNTTSLSHSVVTGAATSGQPVSTLDVSTSVPSAEPASFRLTLAPASAPVMQGGTTSFSIEAGNGPPRADGARLSVDGLPTGVRAAFIPSRIGAGQSAQMLVTASPGAATGGMSFTVKAAQDSGQTSTVVGALTVLVGNRTALAGRVVDTDRKALSRVSIILENLTVSTDANGNFLMLDPPPGEQVVLIDGDPAGSPQNRYPTIPISLTIAANRLNELPYLPHLHRQHERFTPIDRNRPTTATDPDLPGVALHLEAGNDVIGWDGQRADKVSIRTVPADRLPVRPLPPGSRATKVYMFYFGKRGGGVPQQPVPFEAPNELGLAPGEKARLWYFDESPRKGEAPNDWRIAGTATVSADGRTIKTAPGVGIPRFCCGAAYFDSVIVGGTQLPVGTNPQPTPGADPVDLSTGIFMLSATDLVIGGRTPLAITRSYRSGDSSQGAFGVGTMMGYEEFVQTTSATVLTYVYHGNTRATFVKQADGTYTNETVPTFRGATITVDGAGNRTLRYKDGRTVTFTPDIALVPPSTNVGLQTAVADANGNALTLTRPSGTEYNATAITDATGRGVTLSRPPGQFRLATVTDPLGRTVSYQYDASGRLTSVTNPAGGVTQYTYDSQHRMTTIMDARGITYLTNTYDTNYRVCQQTQADGGVYTMHYVTTDIATTPASLQLLNEAAAGGPISQAACSGTGSMSPVVATVLVDPRGNPTTYRFNAASSLVSVTDALGQTTTYDRDPTTSLVQSVTDRLGRVTSYTYDARGNVLTVTDPAGNALTMAYEPTFNKVTSIHDPLNRVTIFGYDSHGNLTSVTDPLNHATTIAYTPFGQPASVTDPLNQTTSLTYDASGNLIAVTDPLGNATAWGYDAASRQLTETDPRGMTTLTAYDLLNRITSIRDAKFGTTRFTYDANGNLLTVTDARGSVTTYTYNSMDRVATRTDPLGRSETYVYDLNRNLSQHTDRKGQVATFTYDALNRRTGATYADATVSYAFDAVGRLTQTTDSVGGTVTTTYDTLDRVASQTTAQGTVSYQYDILGRRTQMTISGQSALAYAYDMASRLTTITQGSSVVGFTYDAANRRTALTLPNGISTEYGYDAASRMTSLKYKLGATTLGDLQYIYDAAGNRVQAAGSWARTGLPQPVAAAIHNATNQQVMFGGQTLTYDLNGNLTSDGTTTYAWDSRNRLSSFTGPVMGTFIYDAAGRRSRKTVNGVATDFLYDGLNTVQEQSGSTINTLTTGLAIDEYFRRGDGTSNTFFLSDALGSTLAISDGSGTIMTTYAYEPFGATTITGVPTSSPYDFTGREGDLSTLKYFRARYYHPTLQRFISEDPIGLQGGVNLFAYVENRPVFARDPLGLDVTISLYQCCGGFNHIGIGVNVDAPTYTVGFYPAAVNNPLGTGVVTADSFRAGPFVDSVTLHTTPEQDRQIQDFINAVTKNPRRYSFPAIGGRHCGTFVQDALAAAGIRPAQLVGSPTSFFRLLQQLEQSGVDVTKGISPTLPPAGL
jgi:RHS repeat-associated protein